MAKKRDNKTFYGMRLVSYNEPFVGVCCELVGATYFNLEELDHNEQERQVYYELCEIAIRFYHKNEYDKYVYDELERVSIKSICTGETEHDVLRNLKKIANRCKKGYNVFIDEDCYQAICNYYKK